jgi:transposase-like protein
MTWFAPHPPERKARVVHLIQTTEMTYTEISNAEGIAFQTVCDWASKLPPGSYPRRKNRYENRLPPEQVARIVAARQAGAGWTEIADQFGVHMTTARKYCLREMPKVKHEPPPPPAPKCPKVALVSRLARQGWDADFLASLAHNYSRLSIASVSA